jgi:para-nitrobenzyl esterase
VGFPQLLLDSGLPADPLAFMISPLTPNYGGDVQPTAAFEAITAGSAADVELIVGHTAEEASLIYPSSEAVVLARPFVEKGLDLLFSPTGRAGSEILRGYASRRSIRDLTEAVRPAGTDFFFRIPSIRLAEAALTHHPRVFMFTMAWGGRLGAAHGLDVPLMFDSLDQSRDLLAMLGVPDAGPAQPFASAMPGAWVNFVKTGSPQYPDLPEWPHYDLTRRATMELNLASHVVDDPGAEERQLWDAARY